MYKTVAMALALSGLCLMQSPRTLAQGAAAQQPAASANKQGATVSDQDINLLRQDIRSQKKQLIAANMKLTDTEATKFWPVYDQFTSELTKIYDQRTTLIKEYAQTWGNMTDDQAAIYIRRSLDIDEAVTKLRSKYVPLVRGVLPGIKTATFFQLERRVSMLIDLQLASQIPLANSQQ